VDYGLGVRLGVLGGHRLWGHTGGMTTYWAVLADYPDDGVTVAVLVNTDGAAEDALTIEGQIARVLFAPEDPAPSALPLTAEEIRLFSGSYQDGSDVVRVYGNDGELRYAAQGDDPSPQTLTFYGDATFGWARYPLDRLVFRVEGGRVVGLSEYYNGMFAVDRRPVGPREP
jgi:hypothetical protein